MFSPKYTKNLNNKDLTLNTQNKQGSQNVYNSSLFVNIQN